MSRKTPRNRLHRTINNMGMSLVEVIVSITILSIVVVPTLNAMTMAMNYNLKARKRQNATTTAETIMESFKGYDLDTLVNMFSHGGTSDSGKAFYSSAAGGTYSMTATPLASPAVGSNYVFKIQDFDDNGKKYVVTIEANPSNETNVFLLDNMNSNHDAIYIGDKTKNDNLETEALTHFLNSSGKVDDLIDEAKKYAYEGTGTAEADRKDPTDSTGTKLEASTIAASLSESNIGIESRTITFTIDEDPSSHIATVKSKMEYTYKIKDFTFYIPTVPLNPADPYGGGLPGGGTLYASTEKTLPGYSNDDLKFTMEERTADASLIFNNASGDLNRLLIYYYPWYAKETGKYDTVKVVNNIGGKEVKCYVMKQRDTSLSDIKCKNNEQNYNPKLSTEGSSGTVVFYHNFKINIGDMKSTVGSIPTGTGIYEISNIDKNYDTGAGELDTDSTKKEALLYELTLTMTESDTGKTVATLTSVMNEK